jgi:hypothetical protein
MNGTSDPIVDATIRKYLADKVRAKFPEDVHLIEPMLDNLASRCSLKELFITCAVEIIRLKTNNPGKDNKPAM